MAEHPEIDRLVHRVARRHDGFLARNIAVRGLGIVAGTSALASLVWVLRGYPVPALVPLAILSVGIVTGIGWWVWKRMRLAAAVRETDRFFDLKDAIASARHLAATRPDEPTTTLQWEWLKPRLAACDPGTIRSPFPRRSAGASAGLLLVAVWLGLMPPSPQVLAAQKEARETRERVAESKQELEKLIGEMEKDITAPEEREAVKMDEFRRMVEAINESGDKADAARQFARIEQKLRDASKALDQRRDEETMHLASKELAKAEETEPRQLGKKMEAKELKEAAEMVEKLAGKKLDKQDLKDAKTPEEKKQKLSEAKKELAKMRAVSKRLAAAGKQRQGARNAQGQQNGQNAQGQGNQGENQQGQMAEGNGQQAEPLEDLMAELDDAAAEVEKELQEIELDPDAEKGDEAAMEKANGVLGKLGKHMKGMHGKRMAKGKLDQLRDALAQAGSFSQGQSQMLGLAEEPGGRKAGVGTDESRRQERDNSQKNGQLTELKGQHGEGPSLSSVEEADSGAGVSGRRGDIRQREFARQTESFVQRDDVPESLKLGVRNYFENLQSAQPAAKEDK
ncbi:hypothetical protein KBB96_20400 [Luteolibacter ambystomatis]|uniref:DUF4175 domain-containing protein n=1 Tax=Luteolibacter ambystomatis TaxID=2824561 RepID=A0A975G9C8_9BACT|nr:hypothetical protein [Luteolibacter ambystomatis]QUE51201.1 hypothetical protein KBB96_20400 [Luteolibacter ambystomatis]